MAKVGRTRQKLAEMLSDELTKMGIRHLPFDGEGLIPVSGAWKSMDCYRWESVGLRAFIDDSDTPMTMSICSWEPMTKLVRAGAIHISRAYRGFTFEFEADLPQ